MRTRKLCEPVVIVLLRRPKTRRQNPHEKRSDPFWEFGSFGVTGCHQRNLMHPKNCKDLEGKRLAFVQGGSDGFKLVYLTPPVKMVPYSDRSEARWSRPGMPFRYDSAPLVVDSSGKSDIPAILAMISGVNRNGWEGRFASKFRTRKDPLPEEVADELGAVYQSRRRAANLATSYNQALPWDPPVVDTNRKDTYERRLAKLVVPDAAEVDSPAQEKRSRRTLRRVANAAGAQ